MSNVEVMNLVLGANSGNIPSQLANLSGLHWFCRALLMANTRLLYCARFRVPSTEWKSHVDIIR